MKNNEIELFIDENDNKYYVLKNSNLEFTIKTLGLTRDLKRLDNKLYFKDKLIHREDGPAIEWNDGTTSWYKKGKIHRLNGPAIEYSNGDKEYYINNTRFSEVEYKKLLIKKQYKKLTDKIKNNKTKI